MYSHAQAPVRIGIAGGGTDLPAWTKSGRVGRCLSLAINMHTHAVAIMRPDKQVIASYLKLDMAAAATEIANGLIRESALLHGFEDSFEVHTLSELSSHGSGLGVSSSIAVALSACFERLSGLNAPYEYWRQVPRSAAPKFLDGGLPAWRERCAKNAWTVEIDKLRRPIGRQDHMAAAYGGLRLYAFEGDDARVERSFSKEDAAWVAKHLLLVKLPTGHDSRAILSGIKNPDALEAASFAVSAALEAIETRSAKQLGEAFNRGHLSKKQIPGAITAEVEEIFNSISRCGGVHGIKVAGAGGGGHVVVACEPGSATDIEQATHLPVMTVEPDNEGVRSDGWK